MTALPAPASEASAAAEVVMVRDHMATIISIDGPIEQVLGWRPEQLVGHVSTKYIHPEDERSAVLTWQEMHTTGAPRTWRGRYRSATGSWIWAEMDNRPGVPEVGMVTSVMRPLRGPALAAEIAREDREQVLTKLADALPVGVFQMDVNGQLAFTNERLHRIVGTTPSATLDTLMAGAEPGGRELLREAVASVLAGRAVDDVEVGIAAEGLARRVLSLALRPLTDATGKVSGAVGCVSDVTQSTQIRNRLEEQAATDGLTRCLNRASILGFVGQILASRAALGLGLAVMFVDVDGLKGVNDRYGHAAGDRLLVAAADRLREAVRGRDRVGRMGGDEFLLVCPDVGAEPLARWIAERIRRDVAGPVDVGVAKLEISLSIGVAWTDEPGDATALVARADAAMYASRREQSPPV